MNNLLQVDTKVDSSRHQDSKKLFSYFYVLHKCLQFFSLLNANGQHDVVGNGKSAEKAAGVAT